MSDDDSSDDRGGSGLYCERSEWNDVTPLRQQDSEAPVVAIRYSREFEDCHSYLRAVIAADEKSDRVVELTTTCIKHNPANYTAWRYRRASILATGASITDELATIADMCVRYPKNFQIWHHRKELLKALGHPHNEKEVTAQALAEDAKNYHVWSHRRWLVAYFGAFDGEEDYAVEHLQDDFRNNSAYNYLFFIVEVSKLGADRLVEGGVTSDACPPPTPSPSLDEHLLVREAEVQRALTYLDRDSENEAAQNYLFGHLAPRTHTAAVLASLAPRVRQRLEAFIAAEGARTAVWCRAALAELCDAVAENGVEPGVMGAESTDALRSQAKALYETLADKDPLRKKHWLALAGQ